MATNRKIGAVIALDGEQQFKSAVSACTRELNTMKSALKLVEAETDGQAKSLETLQKKHSALNDVLEATRKRQEDVKKGLKHAEEDFKRVGEETEEYKKKLKEAEEALEKMKSSSDSTEKELKEQEETVKGLAATVASGEKAYEKGAIRIQEWEKKLNDAKTETVRAEQAVDNIEDEMRELEKATDNTADELDDYAKEARDADKATGELDISMKSMLKNSAVNLAVDAMRAIGDKAIEAGKYIIEVGSEFESSMSRVSAISGATGGDLAALTEKAKEMGSTTKFSASESASAFEYMAMAGWKTEEMLQGIDGVMALAAASGEDLATTSDIVTDALTAFGESAEESGRLADIMAAASSNANTNVSMMGETFKYAAPVAGALGISMEDTAVAVGLMANAGVKASQAGTALRTGLTNLAKPTKQMQDAMDKYNVALVENEDGSVNLRETMIQLREKIGSLSETEQAAATAAIFGKDSMAGWMAVINASDEDFDKLTTAIDNSNGAAQGMSDTMQNNLSGSLTIFKSALEGLGIELYNKAVEPLTGAVEFATSVISGLTKLIHGDGGGNGLDSIMDDFLGDLKESNKEVEESLANAKATRDNAETKVAEIQTYADEFDTILGKCEEFNEITLDDGRKAIVDSTGEIVEVIGEVGTEASDVAKDLEEWAPSGINTAGVSASTEAARQMLGYIREDFDETTGAIKQTYVITDEFTKAKISAMVDTLGGSVDGLSEAWDRQTGALTASKTELDEWFSTAKDVAMYTALQEALEKVNKAWGDASVNAALANSAFKNAINDFNEVNGSSIATWEDFEKYMNQNAMNWTDEAKAVKAAHDAQVECNTVLDDARQTMKEVNESLDPLVEAYGKEGKAADEAADGTDNLNNSLEGTDEIAEDAQAALDHAAEHAKNLAEATREASKDITSSFDEYKRSAEDAFSVDPFGKWEQDTEKGMLAFEESMKSQIDGMLMYKDNLSTVKDNLGEISPEFVQYLEDMGASGAQLVAEFADAFRNGDTEAVYRLMDEYKQATDIQEAISETLAADKLAMMTGLAGLTDEDVRNWEELKTVFDEGLLVIQGKGEEIATGTTESFMAAVEAAKAVGLQVPEGLAESIRTSEDPALAIQEAVDTINAEIQGRAEGLAQVARELGIEVPENVSEAIKTGQGVPAACDELISLITKKDPEFESAGKEVGQAAGGATATGITDKTSDVTGAADSVVNAAKDSASIATTNFRIVGNSAMEALKLGIGEKSQEVADRLNAVLTIAKNQATTHANNLFPALGEDIDLHIIAGMNNRMEDVKTASAGVSNAASSEMQDYTKFRDAGISATNAYGDGIYSRLSYATDKAGGIAGDATGKFVRTNDAWYAGYNTSVGLGNGIYAGQSHAVNAAINVAQSALDNARGVLGIYSPSRKFHEIGDYTIQGFVEGLEDGQSDVEKAINDTFGVDPAVADTLTDFDLASGTIGFDTRSGGMTDKMDVLIELVGRYMPEILTATEADKQLSMGDDFMPVIASKTSEIIGRNTRRLM